jgi:vacuolar-type H+-ATPase subunit E/Vma4
MHLDASHRVSGERRLTMALTASLIRPDVHARFERIKARAFEKAEQEAQEALKRVRASARQERKEIERQGLRPDK